MKPALTEALQRERRTLWGLLGENDGSAALIARREGMVGLTYCNGTYQVMTKEGEPVLKLNTEAFRER